MQIEGYVHWGIWHAPAGTAAAPGYCPTCPTDEGEGWFTAGGSKLEAG